MFLRVFLLPPRGFGPLDFHQKVWNLNMVERTLFKIFSPRFIVFIDIFIYPHKNQTTLRLNKPLNTINTALDVSRIIWNRSSWFRTFIFCSQTSTACNRIPFAHSQPLSTLSICKIKEISGSPFQGSCGRLWGISGVKHEYWTPHTALETQTLLLSDPYLKYLPQCAPRNLLFPQRLHSTETPSDGGRWLCKKKPLHKGWSFPKIDW